MHRKAEVAQLLYQINRVCLDLHQDKVEVAYFYRSISMILICLFTSVLYEVKATEIIAKIIIIISSTFDFLSIGIWYHGCVGQRYTTDNIPRVKRNGHYYSYNIIIPLSTHIEITK